MKRILVTGGSGMVGKYLRELLPQADYPSSHQLNLLNPSHTYSYVQSYKPEIVIHLAAVVGGIRDNIERPLVYFEDNLMMNFNIVRACREFKVNNFITALSTCVFPDNFDRIEEFQYPMKEEDLHFGPPTPTNYGYGYAKRVMGVHVDVINATNNNSNYCYLTPCNLFGEYDKYDDKGSHFVSALLKKIIVAQKEGRSYIELLGTGKPLRQFMYAKDLARLIVEMIETNTYTNLNVCPSEVLSINELTLATLKALGLEHFEIRYSGDLDGQYRKDASNEKLKQVFPNFKLTPFEAAVKHTYEYLITKQVV